MAILDALRQIYFFREFSEKELEEVRDIVSRVCFAPDTIIFEEAESGDACYLILSGSVRVTQNTSAGEEQIARLGEGSLFGELALLGNHLRTASVTTNEFTEALRIGEDDLIEHMADDPALALRFYRALAQELAKRVATTTTELSTLKGLFQRHQVV